MPYVWAIRKEMMEGNTGQVNLYGNNMVKEKNFVSIMAVNEKGKIISATDKKYEGKDFVSLSSPFYINVNNTVINEVNDSLLTVASPVMGFNTRLGTLIINYSLSKNVIAP